MLSLILSTFNNMKPKTPQHILELSAVEQKNFIDSFDLVLSDCDGVLWMIINAIPNTGTALKLILNAGKQCKFVTNNCSRSDAEYIKKFEAMGVEQVQPADIVTPPKTMLKYLKKFKPGEKVFSLCCLGANALFRENGIEVETLQKRLHWTGAAITEELSHLDHKVGAVLFDTNFDLSFTELTKASHYLLHPDCVLLAGGNDKIYPMTQNLSIAGFNYFLEHISNFSQKQPIFLGKPSPKLGKMLIEMFNITEPKRCLFIGDNLEQDIQLGNSCGFQTLLVLTGVATKKDMLQATDGPASPNFYADGIADFIELFANLKKHNL